MSAIPVSDSVGNGPAISHRHTTPVTHQHTTGGKMLSPIVHFLDSSVQQFSIGTRATGHEFYNLVMLKLQLSECDYFDMEFMNDEGLLTWLDHDKLLNKQVNAAHELIFLFSVKFYTPHPNLLEDEFTRYLFALQIKKDLYTGVLYCNENTAALLAAFIVQGELGDFLEDEYTNHSYLTNLRLIKQATPEFLMRVMEYHRSLTGMTPAEADFSLLDTARKVEHYGMRMVSAKDHEGMLLHLAVTHMGILVYQNHLRINTFSWAKIRKLSFKRRKFLLKLHPEEFAYFIDTVEFHFASRNECKHFWKQCIEHHAFFRCYDVKTPAKRKGRVLSRGSSFRYPGRTQKQLIEYMRENSTKSSPFERSSSLGRQTPIRASSVHTVQRMASGHLRHSEMAAGNAADSLYTGYHSGPAGRTVSPSSGVIHGIPCGYATDQMPYYSNRQQQQMQQQQYKIVTNSGMRSPDSRTTSTNSSVTRSVPCTIGPRVDTRERELSGGAAALGGHSFCPSLSQSIVSGVTKNPVNQFHNPENSMMAPYSNRSPPCVLPSMSVLHPSRSISSSSQVLGNSLPPAMSIISPSFHIHGGSNTTHSQQQQQQHQHHHPNLSQIRQHYTTMLPSQVTHPNENSHLTLHHCGMEVTNHPSNYRETTTNKTHIHGELNISNVIVPPISTSLHRNTSQPQNSINYTSQSGSLIHRQQSNPNFIHSNTSQALPPSSITLVSQSSIKDSTRSTGVERNVPLSSSPNVNKTNSIPTVPIHTASTSILSKPSAVTSQSPQSVQNSLRMQLQTAGERMNSSTEYTGNGQMEFLSPLARPNSLLPESRNTKVSSAGSTDLSSASFAQNVGAEKAIFDQPPSNQRSSAENSVNPVEKVSLMEDDDTSSMGILSKGWESESSRVGRLSVSRHRDQRQQGSLNRSYGSRSTSCCSESLSTSSSMSANEEDGISLRKTRYRRHNRSSSSAVGGGSSVKSLTSRNTSQNSLDLEGEQYDTQSPGENSYSRSQSHRHHKHRHRHSRPSSRSGANTDTEIPLNNSLAGTSYPRGSMSDTGTMPKRRDYSGRSSVATSCSGGSRPTTPTTSAGSYAPNGSSHNGSSAKGPHSSNGDLSSGHKRSSHRRHRRGSSVSAQDRIYSLLKELVMTERTYKKDLEVICVWLRKALASGSSKAEARLPQWLSKAIYSLLDPIYDLHVQMLKDFETRLVEDWDRGKGSRSGLDCEDSNLHLESGGGDSVAAATSISRGLGGGNSSPGDQTASSKGRIGELFLNNLAMLPAYRKYFEHQESLLNDIESIVRSDLNVQRGIREFESQKICYLPLYAFFLKPAHRLLHYRIILERLLRHFDDKNPDLNGCRVAHAQIVDVLQRFRDTYRRMENRYKLMELQRDLIGIQRLPQEGGEKEASGQTEASPNANKGMGVLLSDPSREFIREGWLQKLSKKGNQPRMFFLFSDQLIYANRVAQAFLQFKVHGQFPLRDVMVEECESSNSFTVYSGRQCFIVACPSEWQRDRWVEDISRAILAARSNQMLHRPAPSSAISNSNNSKETLSQNMNEREGAEQDLDVCGITSNLSASLEKSLVPQRANTSTHVCWHRNLTLAMTDILRTNEYQISGYLLRKFKNSQGWQKLWVVFCNLCLFFYKSYQDDSPLASLPLLGYSVLHPEPNDHIRKDHVFKLQFKTHIYFFRVDNGFTFERWFEVLSCATSISNRGKATFSGSSRQTG